MSTSKQATDRSTANITAIIDSALKEYKKLTKQDLQTHPFAAAFENSNSPDSVINIFRKQAHAFDNFRKGDGMLMAKLTPIVNILFTNSETLGQGVGLHFSPAKTIFTGIGVLLGAVRDVIANYEALVKLFERIQFFLQRLHFITVSPTPELIELLAKIMAQILSILALSTKTTKESRIKIVMKRLMGKAEVEDALQRLDVLTQEANLMTVAVEATHDVNANVKANQELTHHVDDNMVEKLQVHADVEVIKEGTRTIGVKDVMDDLRRNQWIAECRQWLAPPNPFTNHNFACGAQHDGTAEWFIRGSTFDDWKTDGSLLWIHGKPGSGKSILCSAIIEEIKHIQKSGSSLVAYYYFDFRDAAKQDVRGLLSSLLLQLVDNSDPCRDLLYQLHKACHDGSEQPSEAALAQCLDSMLDLPGQSPIYLIIDALDECPNYTGTPSAREKVLNFVEDLVQSEHSNLSICVTSRPEQDINTALNPLTPPSRRVSLHEEGGQMEDINNYVRSFVKNDQNMRRWRTEDKERVIRVLSERAEGMFRWVFCQLETLRRCMPSNISKALDELPITLDDTYERILQGISKQKFQHAHRLFQCIVAAVRPLRVEELGEILAIEFGPNEGANLVESLRPGNPEKAVLSACSSLIAIVNDQGTRIVQFSHFSVGEFLTSDRLQTSGVGHICDHYFSLEQAHICLARACIAVLLQLDEKVDRERVATYPLAQYASWHWLDHAKFGNVQSHIQDALEQLFNPKWTHLRACIWMHNVEDDWKDYSSSKQPPPLKATPLYYAAFCGFSDLAKWLITEHVEDVNARCYDDRTPLHAASQEGHVDAVRLLLDHGAHVNSQERVNWMPLHFASYWGSLKVVQLLLEHGADSNARSASRKSPVYLASESGHLEVVRLLGDHGADVLLRGDTNLTPFRIATQVGHHDVAQLLLEYGAKSE